MLLVGMSLAPPLRLPDRPPVSGDTARELAQLRPAVRGLIAHVLGRSARDPDVEDAEHEVLRRALEGRHRLRDGDPLRPWLFGIARHVALDARRARRRDAADDGVLETLVDPAPGPEAALERLERAQRLDRALGALDEAQRTALLMFHVEGLGYREIADRLGVPVGTVGTWIARGRKRMATELMKGDGAR